MTWSIRPARAMLALASVLLLAVGAGCGTSPTGPTDSTGGNVTAPPEGPKVLKVNADGTANWVELPMALRTSTPLPGTDGTVYDSRRYLSVTQRIDGALGGRVVCGRYAVAVPPGAFLGVGMVTVTLPDSTLMLCNLEVSPAELNNFLLPVNLTLHTTGTTAELDSLDIYWWDPAKDRWTAMGSQKSNLLEPILVDEILTAQPAEGVSLPLSHFSTYAGGKAGW